MTPLGPRDTDQHLTWLVHEDAKEGVDYDIESMRWIDSVTMTDSQTPAPESRSPSQSSRPSIRLLISITAVQTIGWLSYYGQAQMYRPLMDAFDKREGDIGFLWSVETAAMVIAMGWRPAR